MTHHKNKGKKASQKKFTDTIGCMEPVDGWKIIDLKGREYFYDGTDYYRLKKLSSD